MTINRKRFLAAASATAVASLGSGLVPSRALAQTVMPRMKWDDFIKDPARLASFIHGVAVMKARKPSDPTSWWWQAAIHGVRPEWIVDAEQTDPNLKTVSANDQYQYWNRCPHFYNAMTADFPIWHRAYVYHFEQIFRAASGDPTLSLPYWDYTAPPDPSGHIPSLPDPATPGGDVVAGYPTYPTRFVPRAFCEPADTTNPLYEGRRDLVLASGEYQLSDITVSCQAAFESRVFFGEGKAFGGSVFLHEPDAHGLLESSPHDLVHLAVGGDVGLNPGTNLGSDNTDQAFGLMADPPTSAFDPLFWIHHSNIDRLWLIWSGLPGRSWGDCQSVPPAAWWQDTPWIFFDPNGNKVQNPRSFYLDLQQLGIRYDVATLESIAGAVNINTKTDAAALNKLGLSSLPAPGDYKPLPLPTACPPAPGASTTLLQSLRATGNVVTPMASLSLKTAIGATSAFSISAQAATRRTIALRPKSSATPLLSLSSLLAQPHAAAARVFLELVGVSWEWTPRVAVDVYVGLPKTVAPSRAGRYYVGSLSLFGHRQHSMTMEMGPGALGQLFDVTDIARRGDFDPHGVAVTFVPRPLVVPRPTGYRPPKPGTQRDPGIQVSAARVHVAG